MEAVSLIITANDSIWAAGQVLDQTNTVKDQMEAVVKKTYQITSSKKFYRILLKTHQETNCHK